MKLSKLSCASLVAVSALALITNGALAATTINGADSNADNCSRSTRATPILPKCAIISL